MTYAELVQKIRDYTEVSSTVLSDTIINGLIEDAEFRILRDVDSDNNRRYATALLALNTRFIQTPDNDSNKATIVIITHKTTEISIKNCLKSLSNEISWSSG